MGCRLPKLRKAEERRSPGKIYSTLRRPQVETKVGVAYTYHFLDFLLGKEEVPVSSVLCLSSVRELPVQVKELYAQGFVLVAVHPFVHPCGPRHARVQRQLHRAVLVRETHSSEKGQLKWAGRRLETDVCVAGHQAPDPEAIQNYVKRIQDMAEQGVMFVGFLQQPGGGPPCFLGPWEPDELSSLHSSPSPIHRHPFSAGASPADPPEEPRCDVLQPEQNLSERHPSDPRDSDHDRRPERCTQDRVLDPLKAIQNSELLGSEEPTERTQSHVLIHTSDICPSEPTGNPAEVQGDPSSSPGPPAENTGGVGLPGRNSPPPPEPTDAEPMLGDSTETCLGPDPAGIDDGELRRCWSSESWANSPLLNHSHGPESNDRASLTHNNNHIRLKSSEKEKKNVTSPPVQARLQLFALYNHMEETNSSLRFYSLRVPLRILKEAGLTTEVDAHWLDHMTQHFTSGAHLVDGFFHLVENSDNGVLSVDGVFIFQSCAEETVATSYDAIVVEQWTVVDGVVVKTDYIPLLQSLAPFGWRLMCVLPTPIVRTNSDGSLSTKQILFLQRPTLQRKRKDFKMPNLRGRNKAKKNATPERERKNVSPATETEMEQLRSDTREEGREEVRHGDSGRREETSPQRDGEVDFARDLSAPTEDGACHANQEEETEIDRIPSAKSEKTVRWTDVCQREDGEDVKTHERIKRQLSERALFSGVC